jgi:RNA polymerase sigma-70 factor, ECF subfamily
MAEISSTARSERGEELAALLARVAAEDRRAFAALYKATSAKLHGVIVGVLGGGALAEEALQDAYVKVWRRAGEFDPARGSAIAWLAAIARNRALDEARRSPRSLVELRDDLQTPADVADPLAGRERSESLRSLIECLGELDAEKRKIILLAYYSGLSREALAARFDRPVATIKTWLRRGLAQLKDCLSP